MYQNNGYKYALILKKSLIGCNTHILKLIQTDSHTDRQTYTHARARAHTHTCTHIQTYINLINDYNLFNLWNGNTYTYRHINTQTHTHTHTHILTQTYKQTETE